MVKVSPPSLFSKLRAMRGRWAGVRQSLLNRVLSTLYGVPMQILPKGHAGLAAAVVLWFMQDGQRQVVMVRNPKAKDSRARLVSCMGLGAYPDMSVALRSALELQLGKVFAKTIERKLLLADRVAASPLFTYTDDESGVVSPVQVLAWVVQIQPVQVDLIQPGNNLELVMTNEMSLENTAGMGSSLSPTHRAIWHSVARHLPPVKGKKGRGDGVEEVSMDAAEVKKLGARTVH